MLSLAGVPPFGGFFSKYFIFASGVQDALAADRPWLLALVGFAVVMSIVSLFYYLVVVKRMYIEDGQGARPVAVPAAARLSLALCSLAILFSGVYPSPILAWIRRALP